MPAEKAALEYGKVKGGTAQRGVSVASALAIPMIPLRQPIHPAIFGAIEHPLNGPGNRDVLYIATVFSIRAYAGQRQTLSITQNAQSPQ